LDSTGTKKRQEEREARCLQAEVEQVFLNAPLLLADDLKPVNGSRDFNSLGKTDQDRWLQVTFTERASGR